VSNALKTVSYVSHSLDVKYVKRELFSIRTNALRHVLKVTSLKNKKIILFAINVTLFALNAMVVKPMSVHSVKMEITFFMKHLLVTQLVQISILVILLQTCASLVPKTVKHALLKLMIPVLNATKDLI